MTKVLAAYNDGSIVSAVDSLRRDEGDNSPHYDAQKSYDITSNSQVLVAGTYFDRKQIATFLNGLAYTVKRSGLTNIDDIYTELKDSMQAVLTKTGAISAPTHLILILVGFQDKTPKIYVFDSSKNPSFYPHEGFKIAAGIDDAYAYEVCNSLGLKSGSSTAQIEQILTQVLEKVHDKYPNDVDEPYITKVLKPL